MLSYVSVFLLNVEPVFAHLRARLSEVGAISNKDEFCLGERNMLGLGEGHVMHFAEISGPGWPLLLFARATEGARTLK